MLTPHPGEAARLLGNDTAAIARDRFAAASELARKFGTVVVLKGAGSLIAAPDGEDGAVVIHQQARVYAGLLDGTERTEFRVAEGRRAWLQMARGALSVNDVRLSAGDGARTTGPALLTLQGGVDAEVLLFDLP